MSTKGLTLEEMRSAWKQRDAAYDGLFVFGVRTTGIFCRPSCPSRPLLKNMEFFETPEAARAAGFRSCKRCQPELANGRPPAAIAQLMEEVRALGGPPIQARDLRTRKLSPERVSRWFRAHLGMTFAQWQRGLRLTSALHGLRAGARIDDAVFATGYESHSGFREAFQRSFGTSAGQAEDADCITVLWRESVLGPLVLGSHKDAIVLVQFADRWRLPDIFKPLTRHLGVGFLPGESALLQRTGEIIDALFSGEKTVFAVPLKLVGTDFQKLAWNQTLKIPRGKTVSYRELAQDMGCPSKTRAVARAVGANPINILLPCHRVIGSNGLLTGYSGGLERKRRLLQMEGVELQEKD